MKIYTSFPLAFSHTGQRSMNQDCLYPALGKATEQTQLFVVCDGMGGADKGEVASQLLCEAIADYMGILDHPILDAVHMQTILDRVHTAYMAYLDQHSLLSRMGSTLALLQLHEHGATVIHIGDSRVYQLRAGKLLFQTQDHRQVNEMVEAGIITAEQAANHPWRNRLSRAVMASITDKEREVAKSNPAIHTLTDVQAGDYFFVCTDGVVEAINEAVLGNVLAGNLPDQTKMKSLVALCNSQSKDNYSGYLIGVSYVVQNDLPAPVLAAYVA